MTRKIKWLCLFGYFLSLPVFASTCPDMSKTAQIPPGWYSLWYMEYSPPAKHNAFLGASYLLTITMSPQPVTCTYIPEGKTILSTFSLQSRSNFPVPHEAGWYSRMFSNLQLCDGPEISNCPF